MDRRPLIALTAAAFAAIAGGIWFRANNDAMDAGDPRQVAHGGQVYAAHCAECHGARLEGEPDWQVRKPSGELPAPPHDASGHTWHHSDAQLFALTKHGLARYAPPDYKSAMPAFIGKLSDADIRATIAFIKSTWPDEIRRRQENLGRN